MGGIESKENPETGDIDIVDTDDDNIIEVEENKEDNRIENNQHQDTEIIRAKEAAKKIRMPNADSVTSMLQVIKYIREDIENKTKKYRK